MGTQLEDGLRFAMLGPVRVWRGDTEVALGTARHRALLALLLVLRLKEAPLRGPGDRSESGEHAQKPTERQPEPMSAGAAGATRHAHPAVGEA